MKLQGGINFRDMGGYQTKEGRKVKPKFFFRSGSLSKLTQEDLAQLQALSISHVLDYRDTHESQKDQDLLWHGVNYECCPANPPSHAMTAAMGDWFTKERLESLPADYMESLYQALPFGNSAYRRMFQKMDSLDRGGLLQHCAVGKDRTGVGSALLLSSLGVKKETVLEDYLKTEAGLLPFKMQIIERVEKFLSPKAMTRFEYMMSANENFLNAAFDEINKRYGNLEKFLETEYAITPEVRERWQHKFTE
ncbi:tyrosine-protein phosphatase [Bdellovibrio svalbardensis]|uniref:Tyrosine-protein phosphatase n=1 Tax=Bdellovibrio svalbardensis TaxID=2972972 RepID=A0ABT6DIC1_9BACT|nr:tyrosine-protein phosphatase [Bdellovibrio svalbardensis]MDG0815990.1 tyrosine-protein phosphatase [Bdellovibrio svalbardensis]